MQKCSSQAPVSISQMSTTKIVMSEELSFQQVLKFYTIWNILTHVQQINPCSDNRLLYYRSSHGVKSWIQSSRHNEYPEGDRAKPRKYWSYVL